MRVERCAKFNLLSFTCVILSTCVILVSSTVYLPTRLGVVKGTTMLSRQGRKFDAYMSIPYARPPIEELRFQVSKCPSSVIAAVSVRKNSTYSIDNFLSLLQMNHERIQNQHCHGQVCWMPLNTRIDVLNATAVLGTKEMKTVYI